MPNPHSMPERQEYMNNSMFSQTKIFIWNLIDYVIHFMQTGSPMSVSWLNETFALNVNFALGVIFVN